LEERSRDCVVKVLNRGKLTNVGEGRFAEDVEEKLQEHCYEELLIKDLGLKVNFDSLSNCFVVRYLED
jgi:hypothetical protein